MYVLYKCRLFSSCVNMQIFQLACHESLTLSSIKTS